MLKANNHNTNVTCNVSGRPDDDLHPSLFLIPDPFHQTTLVFPGMRYVLRNFHVQQANTNEFLTLFKLGFSDKSSS